MFREIKLKCVNCGYVSDTFNIVIVGHYHGAFTYAAQCPLCNSQKVDYISIDRKPDLEILITGDNKLKMSTKRK